MTIVSSSTTINAPVAKVFKFLTDVENHKQWQPSLLEASVTPAGPIAVGSIYHYVTEVMGTKYPSQIQVSAYELNTKWSFKTMGVPRPMETAYTFEAAGSGTKLTMAMDMPAGAYPPAAEPMVLQQTQKSLDEQCAKVKQVLEK